MKSKTGLPLALRNGYTLVPDKELQQSFTEKKPKKNPRTMSSDTSCWKFSVSRKETFTVHLGGRDIITAIRLLLLLCHMVH